MFCESGNDSLVMEETSELDDDLQGFPNKSAVPKLLAWCVLGEVENCDIT
jgi:hypothetical protein